MGEIPAFGNSAFPRRRGVRTAAWIFVWCLLVHWTGRPAYPQTDSIPQRGFRGNNFRARVVGITNTQAVLAYTAPDSNPCTVEVSESNAYSPLVHDVDAALFTGANSDARLTSVNSGTSRMVVVGARLSQAALDGNVYSRALQAYTTYHYRVACGATVTTGTFTTANIPVQMTYQDIPQLDTAAPGNTINPTLSSTDRSQVIVDPHTGAKLLRMSLPGDIKGSGPYLYFGGFTRMCGDSLIGPGPGYLCSFPQGDGGLGVLYYILPSGQARYLGINRWGVAYPYINPSNSKFYSVSGKDVIQWTYTGDYVTSNPTFSSTTVISGFAAQIHSFDSSFTVADFGCGINPVRGDYVSFQCRRGNQDTYGWLAVFQISTGSIVAAMRVDSNIKTRQCAIHQTLPMDTEAGIEITTHGFVNGDGFGGGPYTTTYSGGVTLPVGSTTISVAGELACSGSVCGTDPDSPVAQVGDVFTFSDTADAVQLVAKTSTTSWVITPTAHAHAPGAVIRGSCSGVAGQTAERWSPIFWKFLADPHGTDTTNTNYVADQYWPVGGHDDMAPGVRITENTGYPVVAGDLLSSVNTPASAFLVTSPKFAGAYAAANGDAVMAHPSAATGANFLTDYFAWSWGGQDGVLTPVTGQLYKYSNPGYPLLPRHHAIAGAVLSHPNIPHSFLDVSGPAVTLGSTSADSYKFCIANAAGECYATSVKGDMYANIPGMTGSPVCNGNAAPCFGNFGGLVGVMQMGLTPGLGRVISHGLSGLRHNNDYPTAKLVGSDLLLFTVGDIQYEKPSQLLMAKLPPLTAQDTVDRSTFVRAPIAISVPQDQRIVSAAIEFGYTEQGEPSQYYCTSRREACVAVSATVTDATPFYYAQTDTYTRMPCERSCIITLPVLPAHVAYYQVKFYDAQGSVVGLGDRGVSVEAAAAKPGGVPANAIR